MAETPGSAHDNTATSAPPRNLSVDYYRVSGVMLIVFGHWLLSSVTYKSGEFGLEQPLVDIPWTQWLVWLMQAVPVFFLAAGYASAVSWAHWRDTQKMTRQEWVRRRLSSTLGPTGAYLAFIWTLMIVAKLAGAPAAVLTYAGWAVAMQLWFLAVYSIVVYLTPIGIAAQRRWGLWVPAALGLCVALVDLLSYAADVPYLNWANYLLCWGAMYTLGIAWYDGRFDERRFSARKRPAADNTGRFSGPGPIPLVMLGVSAVMLAVLIGYGPYPVCMIDIPGQHIQNSSPPSLAMFFFGCAQTGIAVTLGPMVTRAMSGRRIRGVLAVANNNVMALYLWHMVPVVVVAAIAYPAGLLPQFPENSGSWWLMRGVWVILLAVVTAGEMLVLFKLRRIFASALPAIRVAASARWTDLCLLVGVALAAYGITVVSAAGFAPDGAIPWHAIGAFAAGAVLVAIEPRARS
ncbi:MAG: acyltransferase [Mycobacterium sp.]|nr:acyltransferase [Mycobacterium sp.]